MAAACLRFQIVCGDNLDNILIDWQIYAKTTRLLVLDLYACFSLGLRLRQLTR